MKEIWSQETLFLRGGKMRVEVSVRYDICAIRAEVGYVRVDVVECWSGPSIGNRNKDYRKTSIGMGRWVEDLNKIVGEILEEQLWDAIT